MELFLCKSEIGAQIVSVLVCFGIRWLYNRLGPLDGSTPKEEPDNDELAHEIEETVPLMPLPISEKVVHKAPQPLPAPSSLPSGLMQKPKSCYNNKRKFFRKGLLMHALMTRKV